MDGNWYVRRGRISRSTYWLHYVLPLTAAAVLATGLDLALGLGWYSRSFDPDTLTFESTYRGGPIAAITSLALLAPSISALVTRLHDRNHSAVWLLWCLVPIAGPVVLLITAGFLPGDDGPNNFGYPEGAAIPAPRKPSWTVPN